MKLFFPTTITPSIVCSSSFVPSVHVVKDWVSPLVKIAEPCGVGKYPTSAQIGRISFSCLPSNLTLSFNTISRIASFSTAWK